MVLKVDKSRRDEMAKTKFISDYSRWMDKENRYEEWEDSVQRVIDMHKEKYADKLDILEEDMNFLQQMYNKKKFTGSQRAFQFGGSPILKNSAKMYNCLSGYASRVDFFGEYSWFLLAGSGVGVSVQKRHTSLLPKLVKSRNKGMIEYKIEDSIEGWADGIQMLISSFFDEHEKNDSKFKFKSGYKIIFDYSEIRPKGSYITGGFKAPGPDKLRECMQTIEAFMNKLISEGVERLSPIQIYDICMWIADMVISGGVRRGATIFLFDLDDEEMMNAKTGNWIEEHPQRMRSNNSVVLKRGEVTLEEFHKIKERTKQFGEPGFVFVDSYDNIFNPCVEISMYPQIEINGEIRHGWQGCNLCEINASLCKTPEDFYEACKAAAIMGTLQAGYTDFPYLTDGVTKAIFEKEALIGVSICGWYDNPELFFDPEVLKEGARIVLEENERIARLIGINPAARATCTKPAGNTGTILQTPSGIHPDHSKRFIRFVTLSKEDDVAQFIRKKNPHAVSESAGQGEAYVVAFPVVNESETAIFKKDLTAKDFLENIKLAFDNWIQGGTRVERCSHPSLRHNISNTVDIKKEADWDLAFEYIYENMNSFSGVSFAPVTGDKAYFQSPFTEVLTHEQIVDKYGYASLYTSAIIKESFKYFDNLWSACFVAKMSEKDIKEYAKNHSDKTRDILNWVDSYKSFAKEYFGENLAKTEDCLKDVYLNHLWNKVQKNWKTLDFSQLGAKSYTDIDTLVGAACAGGQCELGF